MKHFTAWLRHRARRTSCSTLPFVVASRTLTPAADIVQRILRGVPVLAPADVVTVLVDNQSPRREPARAAQESPAERRRDVGRRRFTCGGQRGDADAADGDDEQLERVGALPGFGKQKAQIFVALLGKQYGVQPDGWREAAGGYGEEGSHRSVAEIVDGPSLAQVREYKQAMKAAAKAT
jgi:hypothetical protein